MTILLVEDHTDTRHAIRTLLELSGHSVVEARDVKSALVAAKDSFDVLLSDIGLPDGDGWSLLQSLSKSRPVTAIAISAFSSPSDVERSKAVGFIAHLEKPFTSKEFNEVLRNVTAQPDKQIRSRTKKRNSGPYRV